MAHGWKLSLALLVGLLAVIPAESAGPARNGVIVYAGAVVENANPEIYAFPIAGGPRRNISRSPGRDVRPVVSPDGMKIVFHRDGRDWVLAASDGSGQRALPGLGGFDSVGWAADSRHVVGTLSDGSATNVIVIDTDTLVTQRVGPGNRPQWSSRGTRFAYIGPGQELYVAALGDRPTRIAAEEVQMFSWSPDAAKIAYLGRSGRLVVVDVATGRTTELASATYSLIDWSADGRRIYVRGRNKFFFVPSAGGAVKQFPQADGLAIAPSGALVAVVQGERISLTTLDGAVIRKLATGTAPIWSPSGRQLAFMGKDGSLRVADVATGEVRVLADGKSHRALYRYPDLNDLPVWRPDGSAVIASTVVDTVQHELFVTEPDGRGARLLRSLGANADDPEWSPDGRSIAFTRYGTTPTIMVGDDRLRRLRVLAQQGSEPTWSPDGSQLAYIGGSKPRWSLSPFVGSGIFVVGADGHGRRRITRGKDWSPAWSPDGTTLAFARATENDGSALYLLKLGTRPARLIFDAGDVGENGESGEVVSIAWSPDGKRIAFRLTSFAAMKYYGPDEDEVVVVDTRGKVVSRMDAGTSVAWSPDGRFLLHGAGVDLGASIYGPRVPGSFLRVTRPDGRDGRGFDLPQRATSPTWQPLCTRSGSANADTIRGGSTQDLLCGLGGADVLTGGAGRDRIFGQAGNDRIRASDGGFDVIGCGDGLDVVFADRVDLVGVDCERVTRR
jgi:Tol biopolymer transport system component